MPYTRDVYAIHSRHMKSISQPNKAYVNDAEDKLATIRMLLAANGCDCELLCDSDGHEYRFGTCLACLIGDVVASEVHERD